MFSVGSTVAARYRVERLIARGGMGEVWEASDLVLQRRVALKNVHAHHLNSTPGAEDIFRDEAMAAARLQGHSNVLTLFDYGRLPPPDGTAYLVMEYVDGPTVADWLAKAAPNLDKSTLLLMKLFVGWHLCRAVAYAHAQSVYHRDIKPLNAFVTTFGVVKIGDFGLARFAEAVTRVHTVGHMMSAAYAAPEQWRDEKYTHATDVYQLGCTLYQLIADRLPFRQGGVGLMNAHLNLAPDPLVQHAPLAPTSVCELVDRCLAKKTADRPPLWKVHDAIIAELAGVYQMKVRTAGLPDALLDEIGAVTQFNVPALKKGSYTWTYPDFTECLEEAVQLSLLGFHQFTITRVSTQAPLPKPTP